MMMVSAHGSPCHSQFARRFFSALRLEWRVWCPLLFSSACVR